MPSIRLFELLEPSTLLSLFIDMLVVRLQRSPAQIHIHSRCCSSPSDCFAALYRYISLQSLDQHQMTTSTNSLNLGSTCEYKTPTRESRSLDLRYLVTQLLSPALHGVMDTNRTHHKALPPTTKKMVRRSRIQFRSPPAKKNKRTDRARADHYNKPMSLLSQQFASKQSWVESVLDGEPAPTANEGSLAEDEHVNSNQQPGSETFIFPKITLPSRGVDGEQVENNVEGHTSPSTTAPIPPPLSDSWFESPPASWVKLAPIYDRRRVTLIPDADPNDFPDDFPGDAPSFWGGNSGHAGSKSTPEPVQSLSDNDGEHSLRNTTTAPLSGPGIASTLPTRSLGQKIVELFAGRKKRRTPTMLKARAEPNVSFAEANLDAASEHSDPTSATDSHPSNYPGPDSEPEQVPEPLSAPRRAPPAFFHPPLLTHAQVIPDVVKQNPCKLRHPSVHVSPAPTYFDTGKVFSTEDLYRADIVHRGFMARHHPNEHVVTGHRRNNSAGQLLDRKGDVWANWYSKRNEVGSDPPRHMADSMIW